jgi:copper chaperone CopZ
METILNVEKMHCRSCELLLIDVISEIGGVKKVSADFTKGIVTIRHDQRDPSGVIDQARKAIENQGYKVVG